MQVDRPLSSPVRPLPRPRPAGPRRRRAAIGLSLGLLAGLCLAACATEHRDRKRFLGRISPPQPLLTATATYGGGALAVQAWLGPSVRLRKSDDQTGSRGARPPAERRRNQPAASSPPDGYIDESGTPFRRGTAGFSQEEIDEMYGRVDYQYLQPPRLALTFTFTNTGTAPVTFVVANVDSALGNYAARPEKLTLAPGQQGSLDPMLSLVEYNFDSLDVTLTLRQGGTGETHVLPLRPAPAAPP